MPADGDLPSVDLEIIAGHDASDRKVDLRLWLRMLSTVTLITAEVRSRLREEFGITLPQFDLLAQLDRETEGLRLGALSKRMMVTNGNITGVLDRLEADGLVERVVSPQDRRVTFARLTAEGRNRFRRYAKAHERWVRGLLADVPPDEKARLVAELAHVKASVLKGVGSRP